MFHFEFTAYTTNTLRAYVCMLKFHSEQNNAIFKIIH